MFMKRDGIPCNEEYSIPVFFDLETTKIIVRPLLCKLGHCRASAISNVTLQLLIFVGENASTSEVCSTGQSGGMFQI